MAINKQQVQQAANALRAENKQVTTLSVREHLGGGSCAAINLLVREYCEAPVIAGNDEVLPAAIQDIIDEFYHRLQQTLEVQQNSQLALTRQSAMDSLSYARQEQSELATALDKLITGHETLLAQFKAKTRELSTQIEKATNAEHNEQLASVRAEEIRSERDRLLKDLQEAVRRCDALQADQTKKADELSKLQSRIELEKGAHQQTKEQRDYLQNELRSAIQQRDEQIQARQKAQARAEHATAELISVTAARNQLDESNRQLKHTITSLERQHASLIREHQQASQSAQTTKASSDAIIGERDRLLLENKSLNQKLNALTQESRRLHDEIGKLSTQFELEKSIHQQSKKQHIALENELREAARRLQEQKQKHATVENRISRLEEVNLRNKEKHDSLLRTIETERDNAQKKFNAEHQAHQESEKIGGELRLKLARKEAELQKTIHEAELEIAALQQKISELQALVAKNLEDTDNR